MRTEEAEAVLVEHYPRLVRLAYLVLPSRPNRSRRVLTAHAVVQRSLPHGRHAGPDADPDLLDGIPVQRTESLGTTAPGYALLRQRVLRAALEAGAPRPRWRLPRRNQLPPILPHVWGLRLFPRSGGADELLLDQTLSELSAPGRAAYVLRGLEQLRDRDIRRLLAAAGATDPLAALAEADRVVPPSGSRDELLLASAEFDACSLQARPTDLLRRRSHSRAALSAVAALIVCGTLVALPEHGWGPDGAAAPAYARNPAAEKALDPAALKKAGPAGWRESDRRGFSAWPARGNRTGDRALLRRALAVWARPGDEVRMSATPGTASGPAPGPAQLLFAGDVGQAVVVLLFDGLRVVRYAEAGDRRPGSAVLDFARTDEADGVSAAALVVGRSGEGVRYLTAPWVERARVRNLLRPDEASRPLGRTRDGVTEPVSSPATAERCRAWPAIEIRSVPGTAGGDAPALLTDLGELTPANLTYGSPERGPGAGTGPGALAVWARTACNLPAMRSMGVRAVNSWQFARQTLPENSGTAAWVCTRAATWRGAGSRVMAQFQPPGSQSAPGTVVATAVDSPACGPREPRVLAGVLWKSRSLHWYVLAAGSREVASITVSGGVTGRARANVIALPARKPAESELDGRLRNGERLPALR